MIPIPKLPTPNNKKKFPRYSILLLILFLTLLTTLYFNVNFLYENNTIQLIKQSLLHRQQQQQQPTLPSISTNTNPRLQELLFLIPPPEDPILPRKFNPTFQEHWELLLPPAAEHSKELKVKFPGPSYSQLKQDYFLWQHIFKSYDNNKPGTFVEIGAADGVFLNSRFFAQHLGWKGLLIEPSPIQFKDLMKGPLCRNNNHQITCINQAACREGETSVQLNGFGMTGKVIEFPQEQQSNTNNDFYSIKCSPIGKLIREAGLTRIDLFSIDVEGNELTILESHDWSIPTYVILIENLILDSIDVGFGPGNGKIGHRFSDLHPINYRKYVILLKNGFQFVTRIGPDEIWVNAGNRPPLPG
jgi:FkbM family methyltransferase